MLFVESAIAVLVIGSLSGEDDSSDCKGGGASSRRMGGAFNHGNKEIDEERARSISKSGRPVLERERVNVLFSLWVGCTACERTVSERAEL
jgi:hypothetical protein